MPDTWGRTLMKRREVQFARNHATIPRTLYDIDFLLDVYDETRMGAFRFNLDPWGDFQQVVLVNRISIYNKLHVFSS